MRPAPVLFAAALAAFLSDPAVAAPAKLSMPEGPVILTVTGGISRTNDQGAAHFDLDMLKSLETREIRTSTIWTEGKHVFTGVPLEALVEALGATGVSISATAINDYSVDIPAGDVVEGGPILAYLMDGQPMSRRQKGPLWVIYPYDDTAEYRTEVIYSRSIWQVDRMTIKD